MIHTPTEQNFVCSQSLTEKVVELLASTFPNVLERWVKSSGDCTHFGD